MTGSATMAVRGAWAACAIPALIAEIVGSVSAQSSMNMRPQMTAASFLASASLSLPSVCFMMLSNTFAAIGKLFLP